MKLLPQAVEATLPSLYSTEETPAADKMVVAKFFFPAGRATWYAVEGTREGGDVTFFGFVVSPLGPDCDAWGYFNLSELEGCNVRGLGVERDIYFTPQRFGDIYPGKGVSAPT